MTYPVNVLSVLQMFLIVRDFGRTFNYRIQIYTSFFALAVFGMVASIFVNLWAGASEEETILLVSHAAFAEVVFSAFLAAQITAATEVNASVEDFVARLSRLQAAVEELAVMPITPLSDVTIERLERCCHDLEVVIRNVKAEAHVHPAMTMGVPASFGVLTTLFSVSVSGFVAALTSLGISSGV